MTVFNGTTCKCRNGPMSFIGANQAAGLLGIFQSTFHRSVKSWELPLPSRLSGRQRWSVPGLAGALETTAHESALAAETGAVK